MTGQRRPQQQFGGAGAEVAVHQDLQSCDEAIGAASPSHSQAAARFRTRLYCRGEQFIIRLNAALKALSDSYPSRAAIAEIGSPELVSLSPANCIRHWVRYSMGDVPTVPLNFKAKLDRDMPTHCPSSCNVQRRAGLWCIRSIAMLIFLSARANNHPTPPRAPPRQMQPQGLN